MIKIVKFTLFFLFVSVLYPFDSVARMVELVKPTFVHQQILGLVKENNPFALNHFLLTLENSHHIINDQHLLQQVIALRPQGVGQDPFIEILLRYGADPNLADSSNNTALDVAIQTHHFNIVEQLLHNGALLVPGEWYGSPLDRVLASDNDAVLQLLLPFITDINAPIDPSQLVGPPIFTAASSNSVRIIQLLLERGANPNSEWNGATLLQTAIFYKCNQACLHLLLLFGANIEREQPTSQVVQTTYQHFELLRTIISGNLQALRALLGNTFYASMNQEQRVTHIRTIRQRFGRELTVALALAIGQRNIDMVRELIIYANPRENIPLIGNNFSRMLDMNAEQLIGQLLEETFFTPEEHESYRAIARIIASAIVRELRVVIPYGHQHILPTSIMLERILLPRNTEFNRIVYEMYHASNPHFDLVPSATQSHFQFPSSELDRLTRQQNFFQRFFSRISEASEEERLDALRRAVLATQVEWVRRLAPLIPPQRVGSVLHLAHERLSALMHTQHEASAQEIVDIILNRMRRIPALFLDLPVSK